MDPNNQTSGGVELDMDAINAAVDATAGQGPNLQNTFDVDKISLDNTPTTNDELQHQLAEDPNMSLANSGSASVSATMATPVAQASAPVQAPVGQSVDAQSMQAPTEPVSAPEEQKEDFTIDSETAAKAPTAISDASSKAQDNAKKALEALKPKNNTGVIIMTVVGVVLIFAVIIAIVIFANSK